MTLDAEPTSATANSFLTLAEFNAYLDSRVGGLTVKALNDDVKARLLVTATRTLSYLLSGVRTFIMTDPAHYETSPKWTGAPVSTTQPLPWPRTGMFNLNGGEIASNVFPQELKDADAELAFQLYSKDSTLDNQVAVKGITSIKAGSVALTFDTKGMVATKILPDAVRFMIPSSWLTDVVYDYLTEADFEVFK